jgi:hypothetical protein
MSEFEDDDIDKIFEEMIGSDGLEDMKSQGVDAIINIEKVSTESLLKEFNFIIQSLSRATTHVAELAISFMSIEDYVLDDDLRDLLGTIYKLTEDLDEYMVELFIEESELLEDEESQEDEEDE